MKLAQFTRQLKPSETLAISTKAKTLRAQGRNIIDFGLGEPDFATPGHIMRAAEHAMAEGFTKYTPPAGLPALRRAIADKLKRDNGLDYAPENIIVSCGAKQALYNVLMVLVEQGDEVIVPGPYWVTYPTQVLLAGGTPVIVPTTAADDFKVTGEVLRRYLTPRTRGIILNSPCNPTGAVYTPEELEDLARVLLDTDLFIMPHGAFYTFPQIDGLFGRRAKGQPLLTSADVVSYLLEVAGVALVPGEAFGDDRSMRLSYASSMAELEEGLARVDLAVQQLE